MAGERILIVEDDRQLVDMMRAYLQEEGFTVDAAYDGSEGLHRWRRWHPDLIILDWMLPAASGLDVCRTIRKEADTPVIMLTARGEETDKLLGLELGADDYITKPFSLRELVARVRAVLRRAGFQSAPEIMWVGGLMIDVDGHEVRKEGRVIPLTPTEFKILYHLARSPGKVFSRLQIMEAALGEYYEGYERTIDSHVSHLRRKVEDNPAYPVLILTVQGVGYKLNPQGE